MKTKLPIELDDQHIINYGFVHKKHGQRLGKFGLNLGGIAPEKKRLLVLSTKSEYGKIHFLSYYDNVTGKELKSIKLPIMMGEMPDIYNYIAYNCNNDIYNTCINKINDTDHDLTFYIREYPIKTQPYFFKCNDVGNCNKWIEAINDKIDIEGQINLQGGYFYSKKRKKKSIKVKRRKRKSRKKSNKRRRSNKKKRS